MGKGELLPCPFCGGKADPAGWWTATDGSSGPACEDCGAATEDAEAWNRRSDRAGLIAGLREAAGLAAFTSNLLSSPDESTGALKASGAIRARIAALEEEWKS